MNKFILIFLTYFLFANDNENRVKHYKQSLDISEESNLEIKMPTGAELIMKGSSSNELSIDLTVEIDDDKYREKFQNLPDELELINKRGNSYRIDLEELEKYFATEKRHGFISDLMDKIKGRTTSVYSKDGIEYYLIPHYIKMTVNIPKIYNIETQLKYGLLSTDALNADEISFDLYETVAKIKNTVSDLYIKNKYAKTTVENLRGSLDCDLYQSKSELKKISKNLRFKNKYAESHIIDIVGEAEIDCYESAISIENITGQLNLKNKYASVDIIKLNSKAFIDLYQSHITLDGLKSDLKINNKYANMDIANVDGLVDVNLYDCKTKFKNINSKMLVESKYGNMEISNVSSDLDIESYQMPTKIDGVKNLKIKSKYSDHKIRNISGSLNFDFYDSKIEVQPRPSYTKPVSGEIKYGYFKLYNSDYESYRISIKTKYADINSVLYEEDEDESDHQNLRYMWHDKDRPAIKIKSYDADITLE